LLGKKLELVCLSGNEKVGRFFWS